VVEPVEAVVEPVEAVEEPAEPVEVVVPGWPYFNDHTYLFVSHI
jgi:hypothetical protein